MSLKDQITKNIAWKLAGFFLALALWFHLATEKTYEKRFSAPVVLSGLSGEMTVSESTPDSVEFVITGSGKQLIMLMLTDDISAHVDLSHINNPGRYEHKFSASDFGALESRLYQNIDFLDNQNCFFTVKYKS